MKINELRDHLTAIAYAAERAPHIRAIVKAADQAGMTFTDFILSHGGDRPERVDVERTRWAKEMIASGYQGEGLEDPEKIMKWLRAQIKTNAEADEDFDKAKRWWSKVRQMWGIWMIEQEDEEEVEEKNHRDRILFSTRNRGHMIVARLALSGPFTLGDATAAADEIELKSISPTLSDFVIDRLLIKGGKEYAATKKGMATFNRYMREERQT